MNYDKLNELEPLTHEMVADLFKTSVQHVCEWRELGLLKGIKTGKGWVFSQDEIRKFQKEMTGYDISNKIKALETQKRRALYAKY